jgi:hypothetical protein
LAPCGFLLNRLRTRIATRRASPSIYYIPDASEGAEEIEQRDDTASDVDVDLLGSPSRDQMANDANADSLTSMPADSAATPETPAAISSRTPDTDVDAVPAVQPPAANGSTSPGGSGVNYKAPKTEVLDEEMSEVSDAASLASLSHGK